MMTYARQVFIKSRGVVYLVNLPHVLHLKNKTPDELAALLQPDVLHVDLDNIFPDEERQGHWRVVGKPDRMYFETDPPLEFVTLVPDAEEEPPEVIG